MKQDYFFCVLFFTISWCMSVILLTINCVLPGKYIINYATTADYISFTYTNSLSTYTILFYVAAKVCRLYIYIYVESSSLEKFSVIELAGKLMLIFTLGNETGYCDQLIPTQYTCFKIIGIQDKSNIVCQSLGLTSSTLQSRFEIHFQGSSVN